MYMPRLPSALQPCVSDGLFCRQTAVLQALARTRLGINACSKSSATTLVDLSLQGCLCRYTETEGYSEIG